MREKDLKYNIEIIKCPSCLSENAKVLSHVLDIPYYNDFAMINISCDGCGYRTSDFLNTKTKEPVKKEYLIKSEKDGATKIVRSSQGTVKIPLLGVSIEPNGDGSSWIRNIEGVLEDVKQKILISKKQAKDKNEIRIIKQRIKLLNSMKNFEVEFRIRIEDPTGNSLILPANENNIFNILD